MMMDVGQVRFVPFATLSEMSNFKFGNQVVRVY